MDRKILLLQWFVKIGSELQVVHLPPEKTDSVRQEELKNTAVSTD